MLRRQLVLYMYLCSCVGVLQSSAYLLQRAGEDPFGDDKPSRQPLLPSSRIASDAGSVSHNPEDVDMLSSASRKAHDSFQGSFQSSFQGLFPVAAAPRNLGSLAPGRAAHPWRDPAAAAVPMREPGFLAASEYARGNPGALPPQQAGGSAVTSPASGGANAPGPLPPASQAPRPADLATPLSDMPPWDPAHQRASFSETQSVENDT